MTALSNYRIRSSNGSENVSASIFSGFTPVDVSDLVGSGLSEDDMELVSYLSPVLQYLGSLCPSFEPAGDVDDNPPCDDPVFVAALYVYYRYLWDVVRVMEDHPGICFDSFVPVVSALRLPSGGWDDDDGRGTPLYCSPSFMFFRFVFGDISTYRLYYMYYVLTGDIRFDINVDTEVYLLQSSGCPSQEVH